MAFRVLKIGVVFVSAFAIASVFVAWTPLLRAVELDLTNRSGGCDDLECTRDGTRELTNEKAWRTLSFWGASGAPDLKTHAQLYLAEYVSEFSSVSKYRRASRSVARVQLVLDADGKAKKVACTAVLVTPNLMLTAEHCRHLQGAVRKILRAGARFAFTGINRDGDGVFVELDPKPREVSLGLESADYMLLALADERNTSELVDRGILPAKLSSTTLKSGSDIFIVGHPFGGPQVVIRARCRVVSSLIARPSATDTFQHSCGTAPGLSGAPIFDDATATVIGMHTQVQLENDAAGSVLPFGYWAAGIAMRSKSLHEVSIDLESSRANSESEK